MSKMTDEELLNELKNRFISNKDALIELENLYQQLKTVNNKLEESEALKSHFISNIRNEIINPFYSIMGMSKKIMETVNMDAINDFASTIYNEAFELDFQLNNIFAAAEIEAGNISPSISEVDIKDIFTKIIETYNTRVTQKKIKINFLLKIKPDNLESIQFKTDGEMLKLIITNLLTNAIDYSFVDSKIDIEVRADKENLLFKIADNGKGISESDKEIIFDRFKRINNQINSINKGHGLGLAVTKSYIEYLGGHIEIISEINKGTTINVFIPELNNQTDQLGYMINDAEFFTDGNDLVF